MCQSLSNCVKLGKIVINLITFWTLSKLVKFVSNFDDWSDPFTFDLFSLQNLANFEHLVQFVSN